jgi:hypothetical protein
MVPVIKDELDHYVLIEKPLPILRLKKSDPVSDPERLFRTRIDKSKRIGIHNAAPHPPMAVSFMGRVVF